MGDDDTDSKKREPYYDYRTSTERIRSVLTYRDHGYECHP